jgi:hypothetical protein
LCLGSPIKAQSYTKEGRNDKGRQTDIKCVIFYNFLPFRVFFIPGAMQNLERDWRRTVRLPATNPKRNTLIVLP